MSREDSFLSKCPHCGRRKWLPFPYNVDLSRNTAWTICGGCKQRYTIVFTVEGFPIQGVFGPNKLEE